MGGNAQEIRQKLREITKNDSVDVVMGQVIAVIGDTCTLRVGDLDIPSVKLKSTVGGDHYLIQFPKVGTTATCISLDGTFSNLKFLSCDEVEKVEYKQDGLEVLADSTDKKVRVKNQFVSFKDILNGLATTLQSFIVITPNGPSTGVDPSTATNIQNFNTSVNQLFK